MVKYRFPILLLSCLLLGACQTIEQVPIDYMVAADVSFPPQLRRVAIVNNTSDTPDNKLYNSSDSPKKENELVRATAYHNGNSKIATESLAEAIANQNYFDEVIICDSALRANDKIARESTLTQEEVEDLSDKLGADFIISLENLQLKATKVISYLPEWTCYYGSVDMKVYPTLKIYLPGRKGPMLTLAPNDSIFWEEYGSTETYIRTHLISDEQMMEEASDFAGSIPVKHIIPYWTSTTRQIYGGGSVDMRDATIYVREKSWDEAFKLWERAFESAKSPKKKMRAAFNIAVYYEMNDDLDQADSWATKAQDLAYEIEKIDQKDKDRMDLNEIPYYLRASLYRKELQERKAGLARLKMQMERFNDEF